MSTIPTMLEAARNPSQYQIRYDFLGWSLAKCEDDTFSVMISEKQAMWFVGRLKRDVLTFGHWHDDIQTLLQRIIQRSKEQHWNP